MALDPVLPGWRRSLRLALLAPFMGHHGRPVALPQGAATAIFGEKCCRAAQDFVKAMIALFEPRPFQPLAKDTVLRASWRLAGLAVLADWIGSSQVWFRYEPPTHDVDHYWREIARPRARAALIAAGLGRLPRLSSATSFRAVTGLAASPSPVQRWAEEVFLAQGPVLALIEEVTA